LGEMVQHATVSKPPLQTFSSQVQDGGRVGVFVGAGVSVGVGVGVEVGVGVGAGGSLTTRGK